MTNYYPLNFQACGDVSTYMYLVIRLSSFRKKVKVHLYFHNIYDFLLVHVSDWFWSSNFW